MGYRKRQEINTHNELVYRLRQEKRLAAQNVQEDGVLEVDRNKRKKKGKFKRFLSKIFNKNS